MKELFGGEDEIVLFYFVGYGYIEFIGGYLCVGDMKIGDDGLVFFDVLMFVNSLCCWNKIVILDSCYSGIVVCDLNIFNILELVDGVIIFIVLIVE